MFAVVQDGQHVFGALALQVFADGESAQPACECLPARVGPFAEEALCSPQGFFAQGLWCGDPSKVAGFHLRAYVGVAGHGYRMGVSRVCDSVC